MEVGLDKLPLGVLGQVTQMKDSALCKRLTEFGLVPGTRVCSRYRTPGGSVTALEFRGTVVALRTKDMALVRVEVL